MKLNLGCNSRLHPGYINVDICEPADQLADLSKTWPWPDSSVDYILAEDIIEHLPNKIRTMNEAWRVLKPNGVFHVVVPTTDGRGAWQDPTHVSFWNRNSFFYFEEKNFHRTRFERHYGISARFRIRSAEEKLLADKVWKLTIILEAVK